MSINQKTDCCCRDHCCRKQLKTYKKDISKVDHNKGGLKQIIHQLVAHEDNSAWSVLCGPITFPKSQIVEGYVQGNKPKI